MNITLKLMTGLLAGATLVATPALAQNGPNKGNVTAGAAVHSGGAISGGGRANISAAPSTAAAAPRFSAGSTTGMAAPQRFSAGTTTGMAPSANVTTSRTTQFQSGNTTATSGQFATNQQFSGRYDRRRGHWSGGRWIGPAAGFAAGVAVGSAFGGPYYDNGYYYGGPYADDTYYDPGYGNSYAYYDGPDYGPTVVYDQTTGAPADVNFCIAHFKSYDINSQTYLGFDGLRHSCP